ncbi:MAG TPA: hypothetical protein VG425_09305 [Casimicrobiaceae bacterium]|jgi:hypothetical protein|nr:hypothetical protein [Casimicrobiaceae bacterium]
MPSYRSTVMRRRSLARTARWRSCVAWCTAVALILPSVALIPAPSAGFESDVARHAEHLTAERDRAASEGGDRLSDVPGSPTHPVNHDCAPCQVIKYLATSFLPQAGLAPLPSGPIDAAPSDPLHQPREGARVAVSPPIRAPPGLSA